MSHPDVIKSAAKFLQTPANPQRPLEEKIRFLIKEKKLTQYQLIAALKQANLYSIDTIEPILRMHYHDQSDTNSKKTNKKKSKPKRQEPKQSHSSEFQEAQQSESHNNNGWSPWWSTLSTIGVGVASFIASYTVSTTASQNLVNKSEQKTTTKLDAVKTEIKEQADLDRERQHRDLMEVVNLLKTQVQCVQQNLGVLKQSIDVIQTQMKYNSNQQQQEQHASSVIMQSNNNRHITRSATGGDDRSVISSNISINNENKPNLGVIGNLLSQDDDGLDWLNSDIVTSDNMDKNNEEKKEGNDNNINKENATIHSSSEMKNDNVIDDEISIKDDEDDDEDDDVPIIYHPDYKDMIKTLPTDIVEIKQQLTDLLNLWQRNVANDSDNDDGLNIDKIKAGFNALNFYINKILKKPFIEQTRKINTYNKQYKERLLTLPRIETLLTLIGYEKDNVFWTLPLLYKQNNDNDNNDEQSKKVHDRQIEFLTAFKEVLSNLFNIDDTLPYSLSEAIMKIKKEREDKENKEKEKEKETENEQKQSNDVETNTVITNSVNQPVINNMNMDNNMNMNNNDNSVTNPPDTPYSNKFAEIAKLVSEGKTPDDVEKYDDMPPDPNAKPSESKLVQQKKPFQVNMDNNDNGRSWFEQYEAQENNTIVTNNQVTSKNIDDDDTHNADKENNANNDNNMVEYDNKSVDNQRKI